jgi:hypothetical protein
VKDAKKREEKQNHPLARRGERSEAPASVLRRFWIASLRSQ